MSKRLASCLGTMLAFAAAISTPFVALAADGELWEVTSQMNIPGMPAGMAGMGQAPQRVCNSKNPREDATRRPDMKDCKVTDLKETGTRVTMTLTCPQGQMLLDQTYNAARTEYKSTMKMTSKDGDMVINSTGRKVGTCDVQQARKEREDKSKKMIAQSEAQMAVANRQMAEQKNKNSAQITKSCAEAVTKMDARGFRAELCYRKDDPSYGSSMCTNKEMSELVMTKEARSSCDAQRAEFCRKLQTEAGYMLAARADSQGLEGGTALCGLQRGKLTSTLCARGLQTESYPFLGRHCPAEAKPLFAKHCAGRDYTSMQDKKTRNMCTALARLDDDDGGSRPAPKAAAAEAKKPTGLDKLKGLFGR